MNAQTQNQVGLQLLRPYEDALRLANPGINQMQARTIVYWALATYYDFDPKPILLVHKSFGCGKTDLLTALFPMVKGGKWIEGNTNAVIRNELNQCKTAFFDEQERIPEALLTKRFRKANSRMAVNVAVEGVVFSERDLNINGWTAVARRKLFYDVALMSRCLIIEPEFVQSPDSGVTNAGGLQEVVDQLGQVEQLPSEGRTMQVWRPLAAIAGRFNDRGWIDYAAINLTSDMEEQDLSRQYEDDEAVVGALEICRNSVNTTSRLHENWIKISDIKRTVNTEYEKRLKPEQVATILHRRALVKCCGNSFQHIYRLAPRTCQLRHLFSMENAIFERAPFKDQGHQIAAAVQRPPVLA